MKRDPHDPDGEYERENYNLNQFCAEEGASYDAAKEWYDFVPPDKCGNEASPVTTITDLVHEVIDQRATIGMATYHRPLSAGDGRDTLQDAIEEAADLLQYLVKLKVERAGTGG